MAQRKFMAGGEAVAHTRVGSNSPSWDGKVEVASGRDQQDTHLAQMFLEHLTGQEGMAYHIHTAGMTEMAEVRGWENLSMAPGWAVEQVWELAK
jgi:hypothetical protein